MLIFNLQVTSLALLTAGIIFLFLFFRGTPLNSSLNASFVAFIIGWPVAWIVIVRFRIQKSLRSDESKIISMEKQRSVLLREDQIIYSGGSESIEYTTSQLKKIVEEANSFTIKFRGAPDIFILKDRVIAGDLDELISELRSHL